MAPKYTTAFDNDTTEAVQNAIKEMAQNHIRLLHPTDIAMSDWIEVILPPERRALARESERYFFGCFLNEAYRAHFPILNKYWPLADGTRIELAREDPIVFFDWSFRNDRFPVPASCVQLYDDSRPRLVALIRSAIAEWIETATNYGMLLDVFNWVNNFCDKGDRMQARLLLPGLLPILSKINSSMAARLVRPPTIIRKPVPEECIAGLQRANHIIAESILLPEAGAPPENQSFRMRLYGNTHARHPSWSAGFFRILLDA